MPPASSVRRSAAKRAASGLTAAGSSSAATARTAESKRSMRPGNASRKNPEIRNVTSTRGRSSTAAGRISNPVTRPLAASQTGRAPISARAWAISSPPVRMLAVPQAESTTRSGQEPYSWAWRSTNIAADFQPSCQAVWVGTARVSSEKKLRPVGNTSGRPRLGAPAGPGATKRPSRPANNPAISASPQAATAGRRQRSTQSSTLRVRDHSGSGRVSPRIRRSASASSRSTVSPALRQDARSPNTPGRRPVHGAAGSAASGSAPSAAHRPGEGGQQAVELAPLRAAAKHVQSVADLQFLQLAQKSVELAQGGGVVVGSGDRAVAIEPGRAGTFEDRRAERCDPPRVGPARLVIFVDQMLEFGHWSVAAGAGQRRGQMIDDDRLRAPLCLCAFAGVVDDKRVEVGQRRQHHLGKALGRQSEGFAGQPFERAMLAEMNDCVGAKLFGKPSIGGEIAVRRHQRRIVIGGFRVDVVAARRLDQHGNVALAEAGNGKPAAIEATRAKEGVALARAP